MATLESYGTFAITGAALATNVKVKSNDAVFVALSFTTQVIILGVPAYEFYFGEVPVII